MSGISNYDVVVVVLLLDLLPPRRSEASKLTKLW